MAGRLSERVSHLLHRANLARFIPNRSDPNNPRLKLTKWGIGAPNLEVFKFGIYIMFPIGWMWYFGTNLENRFSVPDFWPAPGTTHKIPLEREEQKDMEKKLRELRLAKKQRRVEREKLGLSNDSNVPGRANVRDGEEVEKEESAELKNVQSRNTFGMSPLEKWVRGK